MREPQLRGRGPHLPVLDQIVQYDFEPGYVVFTMPAPKRLRVEAGGEVVADTVEGVILFESDHLPIYYFPIASVRMDLFERSERKTPLSLHGRGRALRPEDPGRGHVALCEAGCRLSADR
jgi:hypothetical protein